MHLVEEAGGVRYYVDNAGDKYEVRAQVRGQQAYLLCDAEGQLDMDSEVATQAVSMIRGMLEDWFVSKRKLGFEDFGDVTVVFAPDVITEEELDEETGEPTGELIHYRIVYAECAYWPPAPVEPHPELDVPKPTSSDFRGDRFSEKWRGRFE